MRTRILGIILLLMTLTSTATASVTGTLVETGNALDVAAQGVREFTERISALEQSTRDTYDPVAARRARIRLGAYVARSGEPPPKQGLSARNPVDRYLHTSSQEHWTLAKRELTTILMSALNLLSDVKNVRNDFVTESIYQQLLRFGEGTGSIPDQFALLVPAVSPEELGTMKTVREKYWILWGDLARANMVLSKYLKGRADSPNH